MSSANIVHGILDEQDLSKAGDLFNLNNDLLLQDFAQTIEIIKRMIDNKKYVNHLNEQSIIEIVLTRCLSALRDTKMITNYYEELIDLLEICLKYNLYKNDEHKSNTAHANIVSDIFSCILLDYLDLSLSERAIPICIRLLQKSSKELSREISSYLNLIACRDPTLLSNYVDAIVDTIIKGNHNNNVNLCRLLYQICEAEIECIYPLIKHLIKALKLIDDNNEKTYLLQIMYLISLNHVQLVIVHLDDIIEYLIEDEYRDIVLDIMYSIASQVPIALDCYLCLFEKSTYYDSYKVCKIISTVGRSLKSKSEYCTNLLIKRIHDDSDQTICILKEIYAIASVHPNVLDTCFNSICNRYNNPTHNVKVAIEQLRKLQSSSVLSSIGHNSSQYLNSNNHFSIDNSVDSLETSPMIHHQSSLPRFHNKSFNELTSKEKLTDENTLNKQQSFNINGQQHHNNNNNSPATTTINLSPQHKPTMQQQTASHHTNSNNSIPENNIKSNNNNLIVDKNQHENSMIIIKQTTVTTSTTMNNNTINQKLSLTNRNEVCFDKTLTIPEDDEEQEEDEETQDKTPTSTPTPTPTPIPTTEQANNVPTGNTKQVTINGKLHHNEDKLNSINNIPTSSIPVSSQSIASNNQSFEKDITQQFCDKHLDKIKGYIKSLHKKMPLPVECWIDEESKSSKKNKYLNLNFTCFLKGQFCLFDKNYFEVRTNQPSIWIHLMFLAFQSKWSHALSQKDQSIIELRTCYDSFKCSHKIPFVSLVTSAFPSEKQLNQLLSELQELRFFDLFEYNEENQQWFCYLCSNPEKADELLTDGTLIQGQLKEKRGKWKFFKRWKKRIYSLTGGNIVYVKKDMRQESLSVRYIKSIQPVKSKSNRKIPKAFEIFTDTNSFILKAKNSHDAEQWVQYIHLSKAHEVSRCNLNDSTIYKTCL